MGPWIAGLRPWNEFVSLTYDPHKRPDAASIATMSQRPPPADRVYRDVVAWLKSGRIALGGLYVAVAATELHKSGWPHVHAIIDAPGASQQLFHDWCQEWYEQHGYATAEPCLTLSGAAAYVAKYICKEDRGLTFYPLSGPLAVETALRTDGQRVKGVPARK
jgi:hypothetical protein